MQQLDDAIRAIPGVYRYFRYSDDMLIFAYKNPDEVAEQINDALRKLPGMSFNKEKSEVRHFAREPIEPRPAVPSTARFDFLGYKFTAEHLVHRERPRRVWLAIAGSKSRLMKTLCSLFLTAFIKTGEGDRKRGMTGK